jgi:hypothetical protein
MILWCDGAHDPAENMRRDQALLDAAGTGTPPVLRLFQFEPPGITVGRNQTPERELDLARCMADGVGWAIRPTGGRAIFHAEEWTYSSPPDDPGWVGRLRHLRAGECAHHEVAGAARRAGRAGGTKAAGLDAVPARRGDRRGPVFRLDRPSRGGGGGCQAGRKCPAPHRGRLAPAGGRAARGGAPGDCRLPGDPGGGTIAGARVPAPLGRIGGPLARPARPARAFRGRPRRRAAAALAATRWGVGRVSVDRLRERFLYCPVV